MIKTILKKKKRKKAKRLSEEAIQIAKKRSERQRRKGRYMHLNAEFQRIVRRDKKVFLSDQCKKIEENNRMGKTGELKKIRDTHISCKNGHNKGQKSYGPNRSKRYQEAARIHKLYKKIFMTQITMMV